ncbi:phosphohistidine phosphatase SixA [Halieaceae bacterium IMCC14734]|uniref:Phosphohistidine phosphatase SixA n=1 Tax=Candidatus Litorirhabdus singularis TaxID=2518993 RepID=A0ABT3TGQ8_9GAMM|nr:phosphohistidine phosphatase SixA [Candidatus Litorirhabdus singularis]MCX2981471.1 phosphohistidine phosphatase SixA [Candidatus Litorirhabdus singularis]
MRIYVLRHGEAARSVATEEQALTARGRQQVASVGKLLQELPLPQAIVHSPKLRARQTAAIVGEYLPGLPFQETAELVPESTPERVESVLHDLNLDCVLLVSHLPLVAELVAWLCNGTSGDYDLPGYPPAGLVALDAELPARGCANQAFYAWPPLFEFRT